VAIGRGALSSTTDANQVAIGYSALEANTSGEKNTAIGYQALQANTTGNYNVAIGHEALEANVGGYGNVAIGYHAMATAAPAATTGYNVAIGYEALYDLTDGVYNTAIGWGAGHNVTTGDNSVIIGNNAGQAMTTQNENVLIGQIAGQDLTGQYNVFVGSAAGYNATSADNNVVIGRQAMGSAVMTGDSNVAIGYTAGHTATSALANVLVGQGAGYGITTAQKSVVIGNNAGYAMATQGGSVIIGFEAGRFQDAGSGGSVAIGHQALYSGTQNYQNVALGYNAGRKATGASASNVYLGTHAGPSSAGAESNKLYINNAEGTPLIGGDFSAFQVHMNANVGIGNTNPQAKLHLSAGSSSEPLILIENTNADNTPPGVTFYKNTASPASGDQVGSIKFDSEEATSGDRKTYWEIQSRINDPTNTTPNGQLNFYGLDGDSPGFIHQFQFINSQFSVLNSDGVGPTIAPTGTNGALFKSAGTKMRLQAKSDSTGEIHAMCNYFGINTTSPQQALDVNGEITTNALGQALRFDNRDDLLIRGTASYDMEITAPQDVAFGIDSDNNETTHAFLWKKDTKTPSSAGTELMRLNELGRLGIGTTAPDQSLHVKSADNYLAKFESTDGIAEIRVQDNTKYTRLLTVGSQYKIMPNDGVELMVLDGNTERVGIGTNAPVSQLHVSGAATQELRVNSSDSGAYSRIQLRSATDGYAQLNMGDSGADAAGGLVYTHSTDTLNIRAANSNIVNVTSTGVGIGTTAPSYPLVVNSAGDNIAADFISTEC
jgi:hypothetical protein